MWYNGAMSPKSAKSPRSPVMQELEDLLKKDVEEHRTKGRIFSRAEWRSIALRASTIFSLTVIAYLIGLFAEMWVIPFVMILFALLELIRFIPRRKRTRS